VNYIAGKEGGHEALKGKKIAVLYHGSPYGKETIPIYELLAEKCGFDLVQIEVPHPGNEQGAQWLQIRRERPDYVVLRGWGVMNPVALTTAQRNGFPVDRIIGNVWSNSEEDVRPAGDAAIGYTAITTQASGNQYPVLQEIIKTVYDEGQGNLPDPARIGSVYHNLGIVNGILNVEAVRIAQAKFGNRTLTGDEVRWGFEHLQLSTDRVKELGAENLFHSINVTCACLLRGWPQEAICAPSSNRAPSSPAARRFSRRSGAPRKRSWAGRRPPSDCYVDLSGAVPG
jgi:branched-chain amino acid transport system substrate-binding protein